MKIIVANSHQQADKIAELIKHLQRGVEDGYQIHTDHIERMALESDCEELK